jgi:hypothetical protein
MRRTSTLSLHKLFTCVQSRVVTNNSLKRGTLKFIYALPQEIVPTNVPTVANVSLVSATRETTNGDIIRKGKFNTHLYIFQTLLMRNLLEELFQKIFAYDTHENSSQGGIQYIKE